MGDGLSDDCSLACLAVWISALVVFVVVVVVVVLDGPAFLRTVPTYASTMHREPLTVGTSKQAVEAGFAASVDQYLVNQSVNQSITQSLSHSSVSQADRLQASGFNLPAPGRRACHPSSLSLSLSPLLLYSSGPSPGARALVATRGPAAVAGRGVGTMRYYASCVSRLFRRPWPA